MKELKVSEHKSPGLLTLVIGFSEVPSTQILKDELENMLDYMTDELGGGEVTIHSANLSIIAQEVKLV